MKYATCPMCDATNAEERFYSEKAERDGRSRLVEGLKHFVCPNCETVFMNDEQSRNNLVVSQQAFGEMPRYMLPEQIRGWRDEYGLTQKEAARILGGGTNAFSKYENGEVIQSDAMDNLLWLAMLYPGLIGDLAKRKGISLSSKVLDKCGYVMQFSNNWLKTITFSDSSLLAFDIYNSLMPKEVQKWAYSQTIDAANEITYDERMTACL